MNSTDVVRMKPAAELWDVGRRRGGWPVQRTIMLNATAHFSNTTAKIDFAGKHDCTILY
jgi:hypothetical protein